MDGPVSWLPTAARLLLASLALLIAWPDAAAAACLDDVKSLAAERGLSTDPPTVAPEGGTKPTPEQMARSGGVIEPPPVQDRSVITPPRSAGAAMPTLPNVTAGPPKEAAAAERTTLQALLVAARAEAERGNERGCLEGLAKAQAFEDKKKSN
ncbi:MAG: hypothetical protein EPO67_19025 [Reyranella sp.]|nr:MAG: hypothetical protein EPO67_19025 [Reyranella sp.]